VKEVAALNGTPTSAGEYNWGGLRGTSYRVDPCGLKQMSQTILLVALSLFLGGCAAGSSRPESESPAPSEGGKLIILDYLKTYLPRPAYLAKFEIIGGGGASLLYPTKEEESQQIGPGTHRLPGLVPAFVKAQRDLYGPRATGLLNRAPRTIVEVTILVVTSDQPLNLESFLRTPRGIRDHLLGTSSTTEQDVLDEILRTVVRNPESVEWEYDYRFVPLLGAWAG